MKVVITCRPVARQSSRSAGAAPWRTTPWPTSSTGRRALRMSSAVRRRASSSGSLTGCGARCRQRPPTARLAITSAGSSRCVAPGFSAVATEKALRTASATVRGSWTRAFHLVMGCIISTMSMNWWVSLCMPDRST